MRRLSIGKTEHKRIWLERKGDGEREREKEYERGGKRVEERERGLTSGPREKRLRLVAAAAGVEMY